MARWGRKEANAMLDRAAFLICSSEIKPPDACERDGRCAHGTRLKRYVQVVAGEAFAFGCKAGLPDRDDFGVPCRIAGCDDQIVPPPDNLAIWGDDNGADRRLADLRGALGFT